MQNVSQEEAFLKGLRRLNDADCPWEKLAHAWRSCEFLCDVLGSMRVTVLEAWVRARALLGPENGRQRRARARADPKRQNGDLTESFSVTTLRDNKAGVGLRCSNYNRSNCPEDPF